MKIYRDQKIEVAVVLSWKHQLQIEQSVTAVNTKQTGRLFGQQGILLRGSLSEWLLTSGNSQFATHKTLI